MKNKKFKQRITREMLNGLTGFRGFNKDGIAVIHCVAREKWYAFYCPYCDRVHLHGQGEGLRSSHCFTATPERPWGDIDAYEIKLVKGN